MCVSCVSLGGGGGCGQLGKYRELTISSLGMEPTKFTASGSPSVTIDVLKQLAGSPYDVRALERFVLKYILCAAF